MKIRLVKEDEIEKVASVYIRAFSNTTNENWNLEDTIKLFRYWFTRQPDLFFVALNENIIVGGIVANAKPWYDGIRLQDGEVFIDPTHQRKGIGQELLKKLIEEGIAKYKTNTFEGITFSHTEFPLSWYKRLGMEISQDLVIITGSCKEMLDKLKS